MATTTGRPFIDRLSLTLFGGMFKRRFVGGDCIQDVLETGEKYVSRGISVSYDFMVENLETQEEVDRACQVTCDLVAQMTEKNAGNIVVKPSMFGLATREPRGIVSEMYYARNLSALFTTIRSSEFSNIELEIDAERHAYLWNQYIVAESVMYQFPAEMKRIRQAAQMHLADTPKFLSNFKLTERPIRIVKGTKVYDEDAAVLVSDERMKEQFLSTFIGSLRNKQHPYLATMRDKALTREAIRLAKKEGFGPKDFTVQFLHGIGLDLMEKLRREGYSVRVYIPFVMPFCANAWEGYIARRIKMVRGLAWKWVTTPFLFIPRLIAAVFKEGSPPH